MEIEITWTCDDCGQTANPFTHQCGGTLQLATA